MGSPDLFKALTQTLKSGEAQAYPIEDVRLTPYLSVVVAILYMMAVDGDISDRESSQLQAVIGADGPILRRAVTYAQSHDVETFLREAPPLLDDGAKLCLLINVADSLMADGELQKVELLLFDRMLAAFGQTRQSFQPHFDAIAAKGRISVLGDFDAAAASEEMTPPKALVVAMLYMMSADGEMATEEVGRLSAAIGGSQALLKASLRYVSQVRAPQFLALAADLLDKRQRMCVLLNACDAMMSDHQVVAAERELLGRMMVAFGIEPAGLDSYLQTMRMKNDVPADSERPSAKNKQPTSIAPRRKKKQEEGVVFERKRTYQEETGDAGEKSAAVRQRAGAKRPEDDRLSALDNRISRTMQDNIDRMSDGLNDGVTLARMEQQSRADAPEGASTKAGKGSSDLRATKDADGAKDRRTATDGKGGADSRSIRDSEGAKDLRTTADGTGAADLRTATDAKGAGDLRTATDGKGPADRRTATDADGASDLRTAIDGKGAADLRKATDGEGAADLRKAIDGQGAADLRTAMDAQGGIDVRSAIDGKGGSKLRTATDADGPSDLRRAADSEGASDLRTAIDAQGLDDPRSAEDAKASRDKKAMRDAAVPDTSHHWKDAALPGQRQELSDADGMPSSKHLVDDRRAFDSDADEDAGVTLAEQPIEGRMGAVRHRTQSIRDHVDALRRSRTLRAGSRLPSLPPGPRRASVPTQHAIALQTPLVVTSENETGIKTKTDDGEPMLLASDEGGPKMSEQTEAATPEQAKVNRLLRLRSAVLLPALFVTYGATMVGETMSERLFITNENIATDARIVHQMASVQQSVYRIAPEAVQLAPDAIAMPVATGASVTGAAVTAASDAMQSDREKAESFLEQRKQELMEKFKQHQGSSALAAERQQWFIYAKSIVLLGLGMAFWGVLFRSLRMLHASTAAGLIGLLLSANGYWLFVRF